MPVFVTPVQLLVLALVLVAGWLLGLASHSGGRKWRDRYAAERDAHAANRLAAEDRHRTDTARIAAVEAENARLAKAAPVTAATIGRPGATATPQTAVRPAYRPIEAGERRGWFDWNTRR